MVKLQITLDKLAKVPKLAMNIANHDTGRFHSKDVRFFAEELGSVVDESEELLFAEFAGLGLWRILRAR